MDAISASHINRFCRWSDHPRSYPGSRVFSLIAAGCRRGQRARRLALLAKRDDGRATLPPTTAMSGVVLTSIFRLRFQRNLQDSTTMLAGLTYFFPYFARISLVIFILQNFGPHMEQKWAALAPSGGRVSSWYSCASSGSRLKLN